MEGVEGVEGGMGVRDTGDPPPQNNDGSINVRDLSLNDFMKRLITHFNIVFKQNKVKWPRRNKT